MLEGLYIYLVYGSRNQDDSKVITYNNEVTDLYICISISVFIPISLSIVNCKQKLFRYFNSKRNLFRDKERIAVRYGHPWRAKSKKNCKDKQEVLSRGQEEVKGRGYCNYSALL